MKLSQIKIYAFLLISGVSQSVFAQPQQPNVNVAAQPLPKDLSTIGGILTYVVTLISSLIMPLLILGALTYFVWSVIEFIRTADNPEERKKGKERMLWGIISLFLMLAFLGITGMLANTFFEDGGVGLPQLPGSSE